MAGKNFATITRLAMGCRWDAVELINFIMLIEEQRKEKEK
jgi:hypothetical protein